VTDTREDIRLLVTLPQAAAALLPGTLVCIEGQLARPTEGDALGVGLYLRGTRLRAMLHPAPERAQLLGLATTAPGPGVAPTEAPRKKVLLLTTPQCPLRPLAEYAHIGVVVERVVVDVHDTTALVGALGISARRPGLDVILVEFTGTPSELAALAASDVQDAAAAARTRVQVLFTRSSARASHHGPRPPALRARASTALHLLMAGLLVGMMLSALAAILVRLALHR